MKEENETIIRCLNKYGKVPETYKLLEKIELLEEENEKLKNIIYTTLEYVDREEISSVGTPFTSTSIGKEIKELLEGEKTFNSIWKENQRLKGALETQDILLKSNSEENQRLNNVLNELEGDLCAIYNLFETVNNDILKKHLKKDICLCRFKELKESGK